MILGAIIRNYKCYSGTNYIPFYNKTLHVTITIGVADHVIPHTVEETISEADNKLYYGKKHGKNQVISIIRRV